MRINTFSLAFVAAILMVVGADLFIAGTAHADTLPAGYTRYTQTVCQHATRGRQVITNCTESVRYVQTEGVATQEHNTQEELGVALGVTKSALK